MADLPAVWDRLPIVHPAAIPTDCRSLISRDKLPITTGVRAATGGGRRVRPATERRVRRWFYAGYFAEGSSLSGLVALLSPLDSGPAFAVGIGSRRDEPGSGPVALEDGAGDETDTEEEDEMNERY
ncbi:hypothetical protein [Halomontanus rarus]|uniref:hypothetical protein n=1 Tax=Halomontanus rarus TaxID=3034020 RepID=UPI00307BB389